MLTRLIESRSHFVRNESGTAASVAIHLVLITVAAYMTTATAIVDQERGQDKPIVWIDTKSLVQHARADNTRTEHSSAPAAHSITIPAISLAVSTNIPAVNVDPAPVRATDEFNGGVTGSASRDLPLSISGTRSEAFIDIEVDTPASAIAGQSAPVYPPSLRAAGIEGRVIAQYIVDTRGHAVRESIGIILSTNDLFAQSVRKAIEQMRFSPARIGKTAVSQVVQQLFVFRLDR